MRILFIFTFILGLSGIGLAQSQQPVKFSIEFTEVEDKDDEVIGSIVVEQFKNIGGFQFSVSWDPEELQFLGMADFPNVLNLKNNENFNLQTAGSGHIRTLWLDPAGDCVSLKPGESILSFRFHRTTRNASFEISNQPIAIEFFDCSLQPVEFKIYTR